MITKKCNYNLITQILLHKKLLEFKFSRNLQAMDPTLLAKKEAIKGSNLCALLQYAVMTQQLIKLWNHCCKVI